MSAKDEGVVVNKQDDRAAASAAHNFDAWLDSLVESPTPAPVLIETGIVTEVADGVAIVSGLARALADELLMFASGVQGIVLDLEPGHLGVILLGPSEQIRLGETVYRTRKVVSVPVGPALLGRVVDAMGQPRDILGPIDAVAEHPIEAAAAANARLIFLFSFAIASMLAPRK